MYYLVKGLQAIALVIVGLAVLVGISGGFGSDQEAAATMANELKMAAIGGGLFVVAHLLEKRFPSS